MIFNCTFPSSEYIRHDRRDTVSNEFPFPPFLALVRDFCSLVGSSIRIITTV